MARPFRLPRNLPILEVCDVSTEQITTGLV